MSKWSSKDVRIQITDTDTVGNGDALIDVSSQVKQFNGISRELLTEEFIPFGGTEVQHQNTGINRMADIPITVDVDEDNGTAYSILLDAAANATTLTIQVRVGDATDNVTRQTDFFVASTGEDLSAGAIAKASFNLRTAGNYSQSRNNS